MDELEERTSYLSNIISKIKVTKNRISIYDWDDTLFFSSFLAFKCWKKMDDLDENTRNILLELKTAIMNCLSKALESSHVLIVTNSDPGWIELCIERFIPGLLEFLTEKEIYVISSKYAFEHAYHYDSWKWITMSQILSHFKEHTTSRLDFISVGDNENDIQSSMNASNTSQNIIKKTIKCLTLPKPEVLIAQIKHLHDMMEKLFGEKQNMMILFVENIFSVVKPVSYCY